MARSPLFARLQSLGRRLTAEHGGPSLPRRAVLAGAASAVLAAPRPLRAAGTTPRIGIVGAGIAGLNAALTLLDAGITCTVFEASERVGGRMHSDTQTWLNQQVSEHCGELIDTGHTTIRRLAKRFGIALDNLHKAEPDGSTETYRFGDAYYPQSQAEADFAPVWSALQTDLAAAGYPTTFHSSTAAGAALDAMSVSAWIDSRVPGGHGAPMGQLLDVAYDIEFGAPTTAQSALNIVYLLGFQNDPDHFALFGQSDETFHMHGGNERLPRVIAQAIEQAAPGTIRLNAAMTGLVLRPSGEYRLDLTINGRDLGFIADHVILALPFSVLRTLQIGNAGFNTRKTRAIHELGYGSNAKLHLQFDSRLWNTSGAWGLGNGTSYADTGYQNSWDVTRAQQGRTGILVNYLGSAGAKIVADPPGPGRVHKHARSFLAQIEPVFPGISAEWNGLATLDAPLRNPWARGSYSYWQVGQYTTIAGVERRRSHNCHFAGEHCSINFQGYMEGGAAEGARAAGEILADLAP